MSAGNINCILLHLASFMVSYLICKCICTFTYINSSPSLICQFHQNNSQLLFQIVVSLREAGAFNRGFTTNRAPQCRALSGVLKIKKFKAPLFSGPGVAGDTNDWYTIRIKPALRNDANILHFHK